ncbi:protein SPEAR1-like isoform X2 [Andrographis paniculata]|uniref:protein SPEAR1-like isoform X2 n=1 Tax=Andrographis paniculata TaxID=175694 RepID=UPI0021E97158|nr:protein SPEAR1-like isoform X2 [Andrographis paniculata]
MGSNYYGEATHYTGNERRGGSSPPQPPPPSSSRKGKKGNSDKPKQPQRGLGVAQLEKIRLNSQLGCSTYLPSVHNPYASSGFNQEDYRLQTAHSSSYSTSSSPSYGFQGHHGVVMGLSDLDKANISYGDSSQPNAAARWHPGNAGAAATYGAPHYNVDPRMTRSFFEPENEGSFGKKSMRERKDSLMGNSESSNSDEIDLELRLSL